MIQFDVKLGQFEAQLLILRVEADGFLQGGHRRLALAFGDQQPEPPIVVQGLGLRILNPGYISRFDWTSLRRHGASRRPEKTEGKNGNIQ